MNNIIIEIKKKFKWLEESSYGLNEENIKNHIICDVFLDLLGYEKSNCNFEKRQVAQDIYSDILISINNGEKLFIEVKRGDKPLTTNNILQITGYIRNTGAEYGILTNGKEYFLINTRIISESNQINNKDDILINQVVFKFNIFNSKQNGFTHHKYFKYLSNDFIFVNHNTNYFRDIAQFKAIKFSHENNSWNTYKSSLYSFFEYYIDNKNKNYHKNILREITPDDFKEYIKDRQISITSKKKLKTKNAIQNTYSHLSSMLNTLTDYNCFFVNKSINMLDFYTTETGKSENHLNRTNVELAINYYYNNLKRIDKLAMFLLCCSFGLDKIAIKNLEWNSIDLSKKIIMINERILPMNQLLYICFLELDKQSSKRKHKNKFVFTSTYKTNKTISKELINDTFDRLSEISSDDFWKLFSPQYVRTHLVTQMFDDGFSLEEIVYLTGIDLQNLSSYINTEKIIEHQKKQYQKIKTNKLFGGLLDENIIKYNL